VTLHNRETLSPFLTELDALGKELRADRRPEDRAHFARIEWAGRLLSLAGLATAWIAINPFSIVAMSLGNVIRWAIIGHHVLHGAFDKDPEAPRRWKSQRFGAGWRRYLDWLDWMPGSAWAYEHNSLHHYRLGEVHDPDVPEDVFEWYRDIGLPRIVEVATMVPIAALWKPAYYGPSCVRQVWRREERLPPDAFQLFDITTWSPHTPLGRRVWLQSWLPVVLGRFVLLPLLFAPLGWTASLMVLGNLLLAEFLAGIHSFIVIVPNHAGDDLHRFDTPPKGRHEMLLRQLLGSANYRTGGTVNDVMHGYLNYQIEHHLWPDLAPLQLARAQPRVRALCEKHGLPYQQDSVWTRLRMMSSNALGDTEMRRVERVMDRPSGSGGGSGSGAGPETTQAAK